MARFLLRHWCSPLVLRPQLFWVPLLQVLMPWRLLAATQELALDQQETFVQLAPFLMPEVLALPLQTVLAAEVLWLRCWCWQLALLAVQMLVPALSQQHEHTAQGGCSTLVGHRV